MSTGYPRPQKRVIGIWPLPILMLAAFLLQCRSVPVTGGISVGRFTDLALYRDSAHPSHVAVFISGDGGWHGDLDQVARDLAKGNFLIIGVDIARYLDALQSESGPCVELASDFHEMVREVEDKLGYERPVSPVIIGHSAGASMVYGILMQARRGTFRGGISIGFSPGYGSPKPFCERPGLVSKWNEDTEEFDLATGGAIQAPWIAIHGTADSVCPFRDAVEFVQSVKGAKFVKVSGADHSINADEMVEALKKALHRIVG